MDYLELVKDITKSYCKNVYGIELEEPTAPLPQAEILEFKRPSYIEALEKGMK